MIQNRNRLVNNPPPYNAKSRYSVNNLVSDGGFIYQNVTGGNGLPSLEVDWKKQPVATSLISFNKVIQWDGSTPIVVPTGYSGTVFNQNTLQYCTYAVVGTNLTPTSNASGGDNLLLTSN